MSRQWMMSAGLTTGMIAWLLMPGCGGGGLKYEMASVKGTITYKGKPLETGLIRFIPDTKPVEGQVPGKMAFANIEAGTYSIPAERGATVGRNRVEIISNRETGKSMRVENSVIPETEQILPAEYNTRSTLTEEVKPGENTFDYQLE